MKKTNQLIGDVQSLPRTRCGSAIVIGSSNKPRFQEGSSGVKYVILRPSIFLRFAPKADLLSSSLEHCRQHGVPLVGQREAGSRLTLDQAAHHHLLRHGVCYACCLPVGVNGETEQQERSGIVRVGAMDAAVASAIRHRDSCIGTLWIFCYNPQSIRDVSQAHFSVSSTKPADRRGRVGVRVKFDQPHPAVRR